MLSGLSSALGSRAVLVEGASALRSVCSAVDSSEYGSRSLRANLSSLECALQAQRTAGEAAVGIAAPQIGWLARAVLLDNAHSSPRVPRTVLLNPRLTLLSSSFVYAIEACLSVPSRVGRVKRPAAIRLDYCDFTGRPHAALCTGWVSALVCHELDHLDGTLYTDKADVTFDAADYERRMQDTAFANSITFDGQWQPIEVAKKQ